jgi:hypothetical protein
MTTLEAFVFVIDALAFVGMLSLICYVLDERYALSARESRRGPTLTSGHHVGNRTLLLVAEDRWDNDLRGHQERGL